MRLTDYLDKGASLGTSAPCLTVSGRTRTYGDVQSASWKVARALRRSGVGPGDKVAILSANDPVAFSCVFGISRAGAVWCPVDPRNEAAEDAELLDLLDCTCLIFQGAFAPLVARISADLPRLATLVCLDQRPAGVVAFDDWLAGLPDEPFEVPAIDDTVLIAETGGTTGKPKGVMLTGRSIETMSALVLMSYPFGGRPVYLALVPLTQAAGVALSFPIMALGGEIVIMPAPDLPEFLSLIERHRVTHTFLPPTVIYMLLDQPGLAGADLGSLQCLWYGAAPVSPARLEEAIVRVGPVLGQLYGQTEAPMISTMAPADHFRADGTLAIERLASAGRPTPLVTVAIMDDRGRLLPSGERGEIVIRSSLVMTGYYRDPEASAQASRHGWHHTGDIGYLDDDNYLFIVDRAKDMIITGGFDVYSVEVEQALMQHRAVRDCAVVGLPDDKWGERVTAVVQSHPGFFVTAADLRSFVKARLGSVKTPKQIEVWRDLPRSKIGKVLKTEVRSRLLRDSWPPP